MSTLTIDSTSTHIDAVPAEPIRDMSPEESCLSAHGVIVEPCLSVVSAKDVAKERKAAGDLAIVAGPAVIIVKGDSALAAYIGASKLEKAAEMAIHDPNMPHDAVTSALLAKADAQDIKRSKAADAWRAKQAAARLAKSSTGYAQHAWLKLATSGK